MAGDGRPRHGRPLGGPVRGLREPRPLLGHRRKRAEAERAGLLRSAHDFQDARRRVRVLGRWLSAHPQVGHARVRRLPLFLQRRRHAPPPRRPRSRGLLQDDVQSVRRPVDRVPALLVLFVGLVRLHGRLRHAGPRRLPAPVLQRQRRHVPGRPPPQGHHRPRRLGRGRPGPLPALHPEHRRHPQQRALLLRVSSRLLLAGVPSCGAFFLPSLRPPSCLLLLLLLEVLPCLVVCLVL
mmetsp:Transcript_16551/g.50089  ORF Transcript_16551/g.50089 Transcript_16551/m.50089 type:complete len:237 (-) Transcript_16551:43-753(-)